MASTSSSQTLSRPCPAVENHPTLHPPSSDRTPPHAHKASAECLRERADSVLSTHSPPRSQDHCQDSPEVKSHHKSKSQVYMDSLKPPSKEDFERIALVQQENENKYKRESRERRQKSIQEYKLKQDQLLKEADYSPAAKLQRLGAARTIQKTFRGYRARRELQGFGLDATTRWMTAVREAQFRASARPRARSDVKGVLPPGDNESHNGEAITESQGFSIAKQNWRKVTSIARRAGHDDLDSASSESEDDYEDASPEERAKARERRATENAQRKHDARMMGLQYFLEMVDLKHRYGSNLRAYHEEWKRADTHDNFFYWLDYGEGKHVEVEGCPRDRLEREQVRYLSREERQYYLVDVDNEGRLCWAKNGARIDTTEMFRDSIHGIVPADDPTPTFHSSTDSGPSPQDDDHSDTSSSSSLESAREADRAAKYANPGFDDSNGLKKVSHLSASTIFNKLLRKSVRKNTWIFVADTSFRLYVGIKNSGAFQHSSFLQGSRISAAGLIKVKNGRLSSLSPLSGHYRPPASNFRAFVKSLKESHVDMSRVSISKSYGVLVGLEAYVKTRRKGKDLVGKLVHRKDKIIAPEEVKRREEEALDKSQSAAREREVLEEEQKARQEEKRREENIEVVSLLKKLNVAPVEPKVQKGEAHA